MNAIRRGSCLTLLLLGLAGTAGAQAPAAPAGAPEARRPRLSWTADRREFAVGSVLTVLIDEYALASANRTDVAQDLRRRDLDLVAGGVLPGGALPSVAARVGSTNDTDSRQLGDAVRQNRFQTEMTVQVIGLEPGGLLRVEGKKVIKLDKGEQELRLSGVVRPEDISTSNLVDSWRIAEAELIYSSRGLKPSGGLLGRLLGAIWP
jgi:flagellar L-ring protein precursor FlgH